MKKIIISFDVSLVAPNPKIVTVRNDTPNRFKQPCTYWVMTTRTNGGKAARDYWSEYDGIINAKVGPFPRQKSVQKRNETR